MSSRQVQQLLHSCPSYEDEDNGKQNQIRCDASPCRVALHTIFAHNTYFWYFFCIFCTRTVQVFVWVWYGHVCEAAYLFDVAQNLSFFTFNWEMNSISSQQSAAKKKKKEWYTAQSPHRKDDILHSHIGKNFIVCAMRVRKRQEKYECMWGREMARGDQLEYKCVFSVKFCHCSPRSMSLVTLTRSYSEHFRAKWTHEPDWMAAVSKIKKKKLATEWKIRNKFMNGIHF